MVTAYWLVYQEYTFSVLMVNILVYLLITTLIFGLVFFFDQKYFKTLNELQGLTSNTFITMSFIFGLLSLAGMPPLTGFLSKLLLILSILNNYNFFFLTVFTFINFFMIYFYIQNMRLLQRRSLINLIRIKTYFSIFDFKLIYFLVILNVINWFGIVLILEAFLMLNFITSHIRIG